jgi:hypothetical protein
MRTVADMYRNALRGFSHPMTPFDVLQNMQSMMNANPPAQNGSVAPEQAAPPAEATEAAEIRELKQRIQELEALVRKSTKAAAPRPSHEKNSRKPTR